MPKTHELRGPHDEFTIEPGFVTVRDVNEVVVTIPPQDEDEWVLPSGLTPQQENELILQLLEDDDDDW